MDAAWLAGRECLLSSASDPIYSIYPTQDEAVYPVPFLADFSEILLLKTLGRQ